MTTRSDSSRTAVGRSWSAAPLQVDWDTVHRTRYRIHQRITYRYDGPVRSLQQRLVVQPRSVHGDQRRISRRLSVLDATPERVDASVDAFGNAILTLNIRRVEREVKKEMVKVHFKIE